MLCAVRVSNKNLPKLLVGFTYLSESAESILLSFLHFVKQGPFCVLISINREFLFLWAQKQAHFAPPPLRRIGIGGRERRN